MPLREGVAQQQQQQQHHRVLKNRTSSFVLVSLLLILLLLQFRIPNFSSHRFEHVFFQPEEEEVGFIEREKVVVFYNLYIGNKYDIPRVRTLVQDQFRYWNATRHGSIYVTSIGVNVSSLLSEGLGKDISSVGMNVSSLLAVGEGKDSFFPRTLTVRNVTHEPTGSEMLTLDALWGYCQDQPSATVAYLHSKGSFHPRPENEVMRQLLTQAALSQDCFDSVTATTTTAKTAPNVKNSTTLCNTCSFRMSPYPHQHTSGNMWLAQCHYIRQLLQPSVFAHRMESYRPWLSTDPTMGEWCIGVDRYAAEHWVHTHPYNVPCDLYIPDSFTWGYEGLPDIAEIDQPEWIGRNMHLSTAPRFEEARLQQKGICLSMYKNIRRVLDQFQGLYQLTPAHDWWGWSWYNNSETSAAAVVAPRS
jgi:hypothetical protein